ncbi:hypothetical protein B0H13DRAFT_1889322 [Mycena leptocephala]|nr:hypothetical protein B0H13DRAFT_1889322 [Mycena leptocephala]
MAGQESDKSDIDPALRERVVSESSVDTDTGVTDYSTNSESDAMGDDDSILALADKKVLQIIKGVARLVAGKLENPKCWPVGLQHLRESGTKPWDDELIVDLAR